MSGENIGHKERLETLRIYITELQQQLSETESYDQFIAGLKFAVDWMEKQE